MENVKCAICDSLDCKEIAVTRNYVHPAPKGLARYFAIVKCNNCDFIYTNPRPKEKDMERYYKRYSLHQTDGAIPLETKRRSIKRYVPESLKKIIRGKLFPLLDTRCTVFPELPPGSRVLEIGCATGAGMKSLEKKGWKITGIEPSVEASEHARKHVALDVVTGTVESCSFEDEVFDLAYGWHVVEHFRNPVRSLEKLHKIIKPGGFLCLSMPNADCWESRLFGEYWAMYQPPIHCYHYTPETITRMLSKTGFSVERIFHQINSVNIFNSLGAFLLENGYSGKMSAFLLSFGSGSGALYSLFNRGMYPVSYLLSRAGQGGRMTVMARRN